MPHEAMSQALTDLSEGHVVSKYLIGRMILVVSPLTCG
jgi:hypothetical protein